MTKFLKMNMIIITLSTIIEDNVADFKKKTRRYIIRQDSGGC